MVKSNKRKVLAAASVFLAIVSSTAGGGVPDIEALKRGEVSLATVAALVQLDRSDANVGYGLCAAAGETLCDGDGSVGYGLCKIAGAQLCKDDGSVGYGLCMLADGFNCRADASVGHGLCRLAGQKNCRR